MVEVIDTENMPLLTRQPSNEESAAAAAALSSLNHPTESPASQPPLAAVPTPPHLDPSAGGGHLARPFQMGQPFVPPGWAPSSAYCMMMPTDQAQPTDMLGKRRRGEQPSKQGWTRQEDALILKTVREVGTKWSRIAAQLPGRSDDAVRNRYIRMKVFAPAAPLACSLLPWRRPQYFARHSP